MDLLSKRIEEVRERWNIVQTESSHKNKQVYGQPSFRLTLEQELVIKGNLSEMWVYFIYYNFKNYYVNIFITIVKSIFFFFFYRGSTILDLEKKLRDLKVVVNSISS